MAGTILIPVPILGATVGGVVGSVGGKLVGGVAGIALSKILEVYEKIKISRIKKMTTVPQLMTHISPESELMRGLMTLTFERAEEERIKTIIEKAIEPQSVKSTSLYPSLDEFMQDKSSEMKDKYERAKDLSAELFDDDDNSVEYYVLSPLPDENAHEQFASSTDLLVLRWPANSNKPWENDGEQVLNIDELNTNNK